MACELDTSFGIMSAPFEGAETYITVDEEYILNVGWNQLEKYDNEKQWIL